MAGSGQDIRRATAKARLILQGSQDIRHQAARSPSRLCGPCLAAGLQPRYCSSNQLYYLQQQPPFMSPHPRSALALGTQVAGNLAGRRGYVC